MIGRHRPVRIKTVNLQPTRIYLRGKIPDALNDVFYNQADHDDREKIRDIAEDAFQDILLRDSVYNRRSYTPVPLSAGR